MSTAIKVENISKKYVLKHNNAAAYSNFRDVITQGVKSIFKKSSTETTEDFWALNDINFEVKQGDRLGVIGRNGAGKSTLLKVISRIVEPTSGKIFVKGRIASLLEVGTGFHPELTGRENIFMNGSILGMKRMEIKNKFDEIVEFSGIEKFLDTPVKRYSSGMYVRLAFAVAAHLEPEILIVDEVLAVGDAEFQKKCLGKMNEVSNSGRTILFVSHNMEAIQQLCGSAVLLSRGSVETFGETQIVVKKYLETSVQHQSIFIPEFPSFEKLSFPYITKISVEDIFGVATNEICVGESWQVRIQIKISSPVIDFIVGFGLTNYNGLPISTSWSSSEDIKEGVYDFIFQSGTLQLTSGQYGIVIGLSSKKQTCQYLDNLAYLYISDVIGKGLSSRLVNTKSGILLNQLNYSIEKIG